ncbi:MAG: preprotein translocase subunit SecA [Granulosicoccaceae bacterium]
MLANLVKKFVGTSNDRIIKKLSKEIAGFASLESQLQALSDEQLAAKTEEFKQQVRDGASLDSLIVEAFAVVREAGVRSLGMRHFDVQLVGGMVLHSGKIAEMRTGEGKTLVATAAVYLNALSEKGVHVVTVNDYLAARDATWMAKLYNFLGLSVGIIVSNLSSQERRDAYAADITYGTNNEYGFDYLRDNMALAAAEKVQRGLNFAIIDEVDSILIDEARTPLIISGPADGDSALYTKINALVPQLVRQDEEEGPGDFSVDEKSKAVHLSEAGHETIEQILIANDLLEDGESLYDPSRIALLHHLNAAMRAHSLYNKDIDYIVSPDKEIIIVDEFTGRTMPGRRWSEGLHQAVEAKEGVEIQRENQTLASITFQNFFRMYNKLAGMTGTADTEAFEFQSIYGLETVVIPTHRSMIRDDRSDLVYLTQREKFDAIIEDIIDCAQRLQPVLVGTTSIETSEYLSGLLKQKQIKHEVLNAKQHEREANIIENAGMPGQVTIATNMAGRGTDIVLGGSLEAELEANAEASESVKQNIKNDWQIRHDQVLEAGGLHIIATERHESRRVDNQLRGRSGRQGDAGSSRFYLSLEDSLMRIFASERVSSLMQKLGMEEGEAIEHPWVTKAIENAQRKVEGHNFDVRKNLLEYDDVANDQRKVVYEQRDELMAAENVAENIRELREELIPDVVSGFIPEGSLEEMWDLPGLSAELERLTNETFNVEAWIEADPNIPESDISNRIVKELEQSYATKEQAAGEQGLRDFERYVMLKALDDHWKEHLAGMDYLRQSVSLRGYAQKNPKQEFKREAFELFTRMLGEYKSDVVSVLSKVQVRDPEQVEAAQVQQAPPEVSYEHKEAQNVLSDDVAEEPQSEGDRAVAAASAARGAAVARAGQSAEPVKPFVREQAKLGRNEPCHCGSGKKFKQCHGKLS